MALSWNSAMGHPSKAIRDFGRSIACLWQCAPKKKSLQGPHCQFNMHSPHAVLMVSSLFSRQPCSKNRETKSKDVILSLVYTSRMSLYNLSPLVLMVTVGPFNNVWVWAPDSIAYTTHRCETSWVECSWQWRFCVLQVSYSGIYNSLVLVILILTLILTLVSLTVWSMVCGQVTCPCDLLSHVIGMVKHRHENNNKCL